MLNSSGKQNDMQWKFVCEQMTLRTVLSAFISVVLLTTLRGRKVKFIYRIENQEPVGKCSIKLCLQVCCVSWNSNFFQYALQLISLFSLEHCDLPMFWSCFLAIIGLNSAVRVDFLLEIWPITLCFLGPGVVLPLISVFKVCFIWQMMFLRTWSPSSIESATCIRAKAYLKKWNVQASQCFR